MQLCQKGSWNLLMSYNPTKHRTGESGKVEHQSMFKRCLCGFLTVSSLFLNHGCIRRQSRITCQRLAIKFISVLLYYKYTHLHTAGRPSKMDDRTLVKFSCKRARADTEFMLRAIASVQGPSESSARTPRTHAKELRTCGALPTIRTVCMQ